MQAQIQNLSIYNKTLTTPTAPRGDDQKLIDSVSEDR